MYVSPNKIYYFWKLSTDAIRGVVLLLLHTKNNTTYIAGLVNLNRTYKVWLGTNPHHCNSSSTRLNTPHFFLTLTRSCLLIQEQGTRMNLNPFSFKMKPTESFDIGGFKKLITKKEIQEDTANSIGYYYYYIDFFRSFKLQHC